MTIYTRWGTPVYSQVNYQTNWLGEELASGIYYYEVVLENKESMQWLVVIAGW